jgi:alcohol dehydrogenase class IV
MSSNPYLLLNPGRVHAGAGSLSQLSELAALFKARRVLIVTTKSVAQPVAAVRQQLEAAGLAVTVIGHTPPEPEVADVQAIEATARAAGAHDLVVGIGGGSAIDVAKILAVLLAQGLDLRDVLTKKVEITARGLPSIMVPTTSGTGAEATPNSIILVPEDELKIGIVSPYLLPDAVILDPLLTLSLPPEVTASTGMDALTHAIECYCSKKGNAFSDLYALESIRLIGRSIRRALQNGQDVAAREDMLMGAYWGGVCIATSSTTAVHALAYPLGGKYRMAHGLSNAILLPSVMAFNQQGNEKRFAAMAAAMGLPVAGLSDAAAADALVQALRQLNTDLNIPNSLKGFGIQAGDIDGLVEGAAKVTRLLDNNPRPMGREDMRAIYAALL